MRRTTSIRTYLAVLALVAALPLAVLQVLSGLEYYRMKLAQGELAAQVLAESAASATRQFVFVAEGLLTDAARERHDALVYPSSCPEALRELNGTLRFVVNLVVTDENGTILCSATPNPADTLLTAGDRDWFRKVQRANAFSVGEPIQGAISRQWVVPLVVPLQDDDGAFQGSLGASVPLVHFQDFLTGSRPAADELVTIVDADRVILARSKDPDLWVGTVLPQAMSYQAPEGDSSFLATGADLDQVHRTWAMTVLPTLEWTIFAGVPTERIRAGVWAATIRKVGLGVLIILLATLLAWWVQRLIAGRLRDLEESIRAAADGSPMVEPRGAPSEFATLARHFSESLDARNRAEASEREAKERYRSILDNAVFGIYLSTASGDFLEVNPALASMLGYDSTEELRETGPRTLYRHPEDRERLVTQYRDTKVIHDLEVEWLRKDGTSITVRLNGKVVTLAGGETAYEVMAEDITDEKMLEAELHHTQKMEAVGRLAGGVAHDFNNILTVIAGNTHLLLADTPEDDPNRAELEEIAEASARAEALTRQLLSFSRKERPQLRLVDVNDLVGGLEKMLGRLVREDIRLVTRYDAAACLVLADPSQLEQVVMNLTVNARDAMPNGGDLLLETRWSPDGPWNEWSPETQSGWVCLTVQDSGVGMDDATRERIFEPFFTTKPKGEGTGLGLSTVYAIVEAAEGRILVDSEPGRGSRLEIWLPAASKDVVSGSGGDVVQGTDSGPGGTILVAEDEAPVRRIVQRVLENAGYRVLLARDGAEAVRLCDAYHGPIDLVITDVIMPTLKGTEVADHVGRTRPGVPVLFMSGYVDNLPVEERVTGKPDLFLAKPFTPSQLRSRVHGLLRAARNPSPDEPSPS